MMVELCIFVTFASLIVATTVALFHATHNRTISHDLEEREELGVDGHIDEGLNEFLGVTYS